MLKDEETMESKEGDSKSEDNVGQRLEVTESNLRSCGEKLGLIRFKPGSLSLVDH